MTIAQDMASARCLVLQDELAQPGLPLERQVRLKIELFPMLVIMSTTHDLSWWDPEKSCPLEMVYDWYAEQDYREQCPEEFERHYCGPLDP